MTRSVKNLSNSTRTRTNVVSLDHKRAEERVFAAVAQVEGYWDALQDENAVPWRNSIDPRAFENILHNVFILERVAPGVARFRIAGQHLRDLMGLDVRGMPISAVFRADAREELARIIRQVCAGPAVVEFTLRGSHGPGRKPALAKMLLAPLRDDDGNITRILGCIESTGPESPRPSRFSITHTRSRNIGGQANDPGTAEPGARTPVPEIHDGFMEYPAPFAGKPDDTPAPPSPPAPRLVISNN